MARGRNSRYGKPAPGSLAARRKIWARFDTSYALVGGTPVLTDLLADIEGELGADLVGATLLRTIGWIQLSGPTGDVRVAMGKFPDMIDADDVNPASSRYLDWYFYRRFSVPGGTAEGVSAVSAGYALDLSSRRRLDEVNESLFIALRSSVATSLDVHLSMLIALP